MDSCRIPMTKRGFQVGETGSNPVTRSNILVSQNSPIITLQIRSTKLSTGWRGGKWLFLYWVQVIGLGEEKSGGHPLNETSYVVAISLRSARQLPLQFILTKFFKLCLLGIFKSPAGWQAWSRLWKEEGGLSAYLAPYRRVSRRHHTVAG